MEFRGCHGQRASTQPGNDPNIQDICVYDGRKDCFREGTGGSGPVAKARRGARLAIKNVTPVLVDLIVVGLLTPGG